MNKMVTIETATIRTSHSMIFHNSLIQSSSPTRNAEVVRPCCCCLKMDLIISKIEKLETTLKPSRANVTPVVRIVCSNELNLL